jgi:hypothetical protein
MKFFKPHRLTRKLLILGVAVFLPVALWSAGLFDRNTVSHPISVTPEKLEFAAKNRFPKDDRHPIAANPSMQGQQGTAGQVPQELPPEWMPAEPPAAGSIDRPAHPQDAEEALVYFGEKYAEPFDSKKLEELLSMAHALCRDEIDHDLPADIWISPHLLVYDMEENHRRLKELHAYCTRKKQGLLQSGDEERARQIKSLFLIERLDAITRFEEDMSDIFDHEQSETIRADIDEAKERMIALTIDALERYESK